jgi:hypothetical protein
MKLKLNRHRSSATERRENADRRNEKRRQHDRVSLVEPTDRRSKSRRTEEEKRP